MSSRSKSVTNISQLNGKKVSVDLPNGGTFVTAAIVFERLGLKPNFLYIEQRIAMEKMRAGEIDAVIAVGGKPYKSVSAFNDNRFHLVPVDYSRPLQTDYLPATLTSKDYPNLIAEGEKVDTIAVPAVLAAYNWAPNTDRYRKLAQFVDAFFTKFPTFQNPPFHPKWKEVSLSAPLPDWQRLPVAEQWLKSHNIEAVSRARFDEFLKQSPATAATVKSDADRETLFRQFQAWEAERGARAQAPHRPAPALEKTRQIKNPEPRSDFTSERGSSLFNPSLQRCRSRASAQRGRHRDAPA